MPKVIGSHIIYKSRHTFLREAKHVTRKLLPNIIVEGDSWFAYPGRNSNFFVSANKTAYYP